MLHADAVKNAVSAVSGLPVFSGEKRDARLAVHNPYLRCFLFPSIFRLDSHLVSVACGKAGKPFTERERESDECVIGFIQSKL